MSRNMDRIVVVGGLSEVGAAIVDKLYSHYNPFMVVADKNDNGFEEMKERLKGDMAFEEIIMGDYGSIVTFQENVYHRMRGIDNLVIVSPQSSGMVESRKSEWQIVEDSVRLHFLNPMLTIKQLASGLEHSLGRITYIAPTTGSNDESSVYTAINAGMEGFIQARSKELAADGIRINMVIPGRNCTPHDIADSVYALTYYLPCTGEAITVEPRK